ncbi:MAG: hypothetical protein JJU32_15790 [Phormidium sp. BM_Day4_Bin.17]|nr:hypothetical protein [Phormidium sp. BM_Day4_Bin.17]UCJ13562.1 MAG: hypothetical protein JWS08_07305 [Phormidium sp. PBR-2020]
MFLQSTHRFRHLSSITALLAAIATSMLAPAIAIAQTEPTDSQTAIRVPMDNSILSLPGIESLIEDATAAVSARDYSLAIRKLQEAREVSNQLSNFYQQLSTNFSGIDNRIFQRQRNQALEAAQLRDTATYQLARLHRTQNNPELAVPLLVQVVRSQNPTRPLGNQAYQQLYELGFANSQFRLDSDQFEPEPQEEESVESDHGNELAGAREDLEASTELLDQQEQEQGEPLAVLAADSLLTFAGIERLIEQANAAVSNEDYNGAASTLQEARELGNQLSNFYQDLAAAFSGLDGPIFEEQRNLALTAAQRRDEATYQLALLHRSQNNPELAIPLLVQIVESQNPTRELGKDAYRQLFELGFVSDAYPRSRN